MNLFRSVQLLALVLLPAGFAHAQDPAGEIAELRRLVAEMRSDYEARIGELEARLAHAERAARGAARDAGEAIELAEQVAIDQAPGASAPNTFNPAIGAILDGGYSDVGAGWSEIPGFQPAGEIGSGDPGFSMGELELNLQANVDTRFYGNVTLGVHLDEGEVALEIEEAWLQTTQMPEGLQVLAGRFFSEAGYLNQFHYHADDFVDRPLPYQAFYGGRYTVDGARARWLAPTILLIEAGAELNWGGGFPATANGERSPGAYTLYANVGGDIGASHSWLVGLAHTEADAVDRVAGHAHADTGSAEPDAFTGDSDLTVFDFVWKWAPGGNNANRNFKVQGEYFSRSESGVFGEADYDGDQSGWYLQGVWQFAPTWRIGARHDKVDADNLLSIAGTDLDDPGRNAYRDSLMFDWSPSEFSRLRLQYTRDNVLEVADDQWYLQYIMSIGAHPAHQF
jgi:hypothetical protein